MRKCRRWKIHADRPYFVRCQAHLRRSGTRAGAGQQGRQQGRSDRLFAAAGRADGRA